MSLKSFHIFFICVSAMMSLGLGLWAVQAYSTSNDSEHLILALVALAALVALVPYGVWFLRKLKGWSYL